jgi:hypothetical protein
MAIQRIGTAVRILHEAFAFKGTGGRVYEPRPVVPLDHDPPNNSGGTITSVFTPRNFFVEIRYRDVYICCDAWPAPLPRDERWYAKQYRAWENEPPTREMKCASLPEGVLADGGVITGYLYFDDVTRKEKDVMFQARMEDSERGDLVAKVSIPFRVP